MKNYSAWKTASSRPNPPELIWQEIFQYIEDGQYDQVEAFFLRLQEDNPGAERLDLKLIYTAALQICRACMQMKSEEERCRDAHQDVLRRGSELQQELQGLTRQLRQWQLAPGSQDVTGQEAATLSQQRGEMDSPAPGFLLPVSGTILLLLICIHAIGLKVFPPSSLYIVLQKSAAIPFSEKSRQFRTGKAAVALAWGLIALGVVLGSFFALFAWAAWTVNWEFLTPMITILGTLMGVTIAVGIIGGILAKLYQQVTKAR